MPFVDTILPHRGYQHIPKVYHPTIPQCIYQAHPIPCNISKVEAGYQTVHDNLGPYPRLLVHLGIEEGLLAVMIPMPHPTWCGYGAREGIPDGLIRGLI